MALPSGVNLRLKSVDSRLNVAHIKRLVREDAHTIPKYELIRVYERAIFSKQFDMHMPLLFIYFSYCCWFIR